MHKLKSNASVDYCKSLQMGLYSVNLDSDRCRPNRGLRDNWTLRLASQQPVAGQVGADCSNDKPTAAMSLEQS